jgi:uncharacterized membrane protein YtjA (UPF0391 family)
MIVLHCCHVAAACRTGRQADCQETSMFSGAITSLIIAVLAAVVSFGAVPSVAVASAAQHIYPVAVGLFVVTALMTIFDLEFPYDLRAIFARAEDDNSVTPTATDLRQTRAM